MYQWHWSAAWRSERAARLHEEATAEARGERRAAAGEATVGHVVSDVSPLVHNSAEQKGALKRFSSLELRWLVDEKGARTRRCAVALL